MQINVAEYLEHGALVTCPHKTAINAYHELNEPMQRVVKRFTTHMSTRNYGVMDLEVSGLQYRIKQPFIVLRKMYP